MGTDDIANGVGDEDHGGDDDLLTAGASFSRGSCCEGSEVDSRRTGDIRAGGGKAYAERRDVGSKDVVPEH
jgi:hypothetical protein